MTTMNDIERTDSRGGSRKVVAGMLGIGLAVFLAGMAACGTDGEEGGGDRMAPVGVQVTAPVVHAAKGTFPARVEATSEARIATRTSGRIEEVRVRVGEEVAAGEVLVVLDDDGVGAAIEGAEAQLDLASATLDRVEALHAEGAASRQELDEARAQARSAEAQLRQARSQRGYTVIEAPFAGVITQRSAEPGDLAGPGQLLLAMVGTNAVRVVADLPASLSGIASRGMTVTVKEPGGDHRVAAAVDRVVPALTPTARTFRVEADLPAPAPFQPGAFVRLGIDRAGEETRWIPADAVVTRGQLTGVYTVEAEGTEAGAAGEGDGLLRLRWVRLGRRQGDLVEVLSGPDEPVVRNPGATVVDGAPARIDDRIELDLGGDR